MLKTTKNLFFSKGKRNRYVKMITSKQYPEVICTKLLN